MFIMNIHSATSPCLIKRNLKYITLFFVVLTQRSKRTKLMEYMSDTIASISDYDIFNNLQFTLILTCLVILASEVTTSNFIILL